MEGYIVDWLNLGVRGLTRSSKGAHPLADPPCQFGVGGR
jgi:hypothetical protein